MNQPPREAIPPEEPDFSPQSQELFDAQFESLVSKLEQGQAGYTENPDQAADYHDLATSQLIPEAANPQRHQSHVAYLTPIQSADALAAICSLSGLDLTVVPTEIGAVGLSHVELDEANWGMALLAESPQDIHPDIDATAAKLSEVTKLPVVVLCALLAPGTDQEPGTTGQVLSGRWTNGSFETDVPAGMVTAVLPLMIENLVMGNVDLAQIKGVRESAGIPRWKALRLLGAGLRKKRDK